MRKLKLALLLVPAMAASTAVFADENYGCRALLCFAGGSGLSECASTISKVKRDLAKGKGFPHCSFINEDGSKTDLVKQTGTYTNNLGKANNKCPDGSTTSWWRKGKGWACNEIKVTFKGANSDGSDMTKIINW